MHYLDEGAGPPGPPAPRRADLVVPLPQDRSRSSTRPPARSRPTTSASAAPTSRSGSRTTRTTSTCGSIVRLVEELDLRDLTVVVQDWGGPIGLRLAVEHPDRVARLVIMNTGIGGGRPPSEEWLRFRDFVRRVGTDLIPGKLVRISAVQPMNDEVEEAYSAPWPVPESKAGILAFPDLVPISPEHPDTPAHLARARAARPLGEARARPLLGLRPDLLAARRRADRRAHPGRARARDRRRRGPLPAGGPGAEIGRRIAAFVSA